MPSRTVAAGYTRAVLAYAVSRGADRQTLIEYSGLCPDCLNDVDNRVPLENCVALLKAAVYLCDDPAFALRFGEVIRTEDFSVALLIAGVADTVGEARTTMNRYARLIRDDDDGDGSDQLELVTERGEVWLKFKSPAYNGNLYFSEIGMTWCVRETRKMLALHYEGRPFPRAIHFTHDEPGYRAEYDRVFGVPLVFGSDKNAMLVDKTFLSLRMPGSSPYVSRVLSKHAENLLQSLENSKTIRGRVESLLIASIRAGDVAMETIAGRMGLSRQTLFRKLKAEGVTFENTLDELRRKMALHYLCEERIAVNEVAYLLGFSEPAAFSRAFKRWTGSSPRTARLDEPRITS
jgi:AraC-like DNA-binding protein